jgi:hypothetical protein
VSDPVSILDVIKRGGYEASLITTFNATLPFYEEFVLRRLMAAGSRYNVVLMDGAQCSQAWTSDAARPRLAGHGYALLPMKVPGAFHPKVCLLAGPRKAAILIGSHNLTLSGFGYNREVTNWIDVGGSKDADGVAALADTWGLIEAWVNQQANHLPESLLEAALALRKFVTPLTQKAKSSGQSCVLGQSLVGQSLFEQVASRVPARVERIVVLGAFFDAELTMLRKLSEQWPKAEVVVLIDPDTVHLGGKLADVKCRFGDARSLWADTTQHYLHAKAIYFESLEGDVLVSGSANPSYPAWMGNSAHGNIEAVVMREGAEARVAAHALGIVQAFDLAPMGLPDLKLVAERGLVELRSQVEARESVSVAVADAESDSIAFVFPHPEQLNLRWAEGSNLEERWDATMSVADVSTITIKIDGPLERVRSLVFGLGSDRTLRAIVHHPASLSGLAHTKRQAILREALGTLGSGEGDVSRLIASVEKVIFSESIHNELTTFSRGGKGQIEDGKFPARPASLGVHVADMPKQKKKLRLLKSGDLAYLLDVLIRRLGIEIETSRGKTDSRGRTEEGSIGQDDDDSLQPDVLSDPEIAEIVSRKARTLIRRMTTQLNLACEDEQRAQSAIVQLVAVLSLVRELRRLRLHPRWRLSPSLVTDADRRSLLDVSMKCLFGHQSQLLQKLLDQAGEPIEEVGFLRALLLWLAWDLGEELTDRISSLAEESDAVRGVHANAVLYELLPKAAVDADEAEELERSIRMTIVPTGAEGARAAAWLHRHLAIGKAVNAASPSELQIKPGLLRGALVAVPKSSPVRLRVVSAVAGSEVTLWEFDTGRTFLAR